MRQKAAAQIIVVHTLFQIYKRRMRIQIFMMMILLPFVTFCNPSAQKIPSLQLGIESLIEDQDVIWGFDFIDPTHIIFTEKKGTIKILDTMSKGLVIVSNPPKSVVHGQGGLLDIALHPDFKKNHWVYISYTISLDQFFETRIARAKLIDQELKNLEVLFTSNSKSNREQHFGSRIVFDRQGYIYFSIGERGVRENAQRLDVAAGKIFRLTEDGKVPIDNPFVNDKSAVPAIWSYGHRNPQGLFYDLTTDILWEQEHGPQGGDEINIIIKGHNYGWPLVTYGKEYGTGADIGITKKEGVDQPIYFYLPSIAPSGLCIYKGNLYSGALALTHLNRLILNQNKVVREERFQNLKDRIRNVKEGPDGYLYVSTDSGKILKLTIP